MTKSGSCIPPSRTLALAAAACLIWALAASSAHAKTHIVRRGETLGLIASRYKITLEELMRANSLKSRNRVNAGVRLTIPEKHVPGKLPTGSKHTVRKGESLSGIAAKYGVTVRELTTWNGLPSASHIDAGQVLYVSRPAEKAAPAGGDYIHIVRKGETLSKIAEAHGWGLSVVAKANNLRRPYRITPGQKIKIPGRSPITSPSSSAKARPEETTRIIVQKRETLADIAERYGMSVSTIAEYNGLKNPNEIDAGQRLIIPGKNAAAKVTIHSAMKRELDRIRVRSGRWKYIVIHHSATRDASPKGMDAYHRARGMENGLAYHFVIGRGGQMQDGSTYVGNRWKKQLDGGHLAKASLNARSIGICLIGDFTKQTPTALQLRSLNGLVDYLLARCRLKVDAVKTHKQIHPRHTACPGTKFPASAFTAGLKKRN